MLKLTVIGKDVSKSLSPKMHSFILNKLGQACQYDAVSLPVEEFENKIQDVLASYNGVNVTIPFKLDVMKHLKHIVGDAETFGAVNTITTSDLSGYNTDGLGFMMMLENAEVEVKGKSVLVLGAGGVGRTVVKKLVSAGAVVSAFEMNEERLNELHGEYPFFTPLNHITIAPYDVIINCTGVGMHKTEGISPVGSDLLALCDTAVDLIYVPAKSEFLRLAECEGKKIVNGDSMLFYQAYYGDCIFIGKTPDSKEAKNLYEEYKGL